MGFFSSVSDQWCHPLELSVSSILLLAMHFIQLLIYVIRSLVGITAVIPGVTKPVTSAVEAFLLCSCSSMYYKLSLQPDNGN